MSVAETVMQDPATASPSAVMGWIESLAILADHLDQHADMSPGHCDPAALIAPLRAEPRFAWLTETFGLGDFDAAVLVVAIAPELDRTFEHRYARARRGSGSMRPDCATCLALLCGAQSEYFAALDHFTWDAPLFRHRLLSLIEPATRGLDPLRSAALAPDPQILRTLFYAAVAKPPITGPKPAPTPSTEP